MLWREETCRSRIEQFVGCPASSLVTIVTDLSRLLVCSCAVYKCQVLLNFVLNKFYKPALVREIHRLPATNKLLNIHIVCNTTPWNRYRRLGGGCSVHFQGPRRRRRLCPSPDVSSSGTRNNLPSRCVGRVPDTKGWGGLWVTHCIR